MPTLPKTHERSEFGRMLTRREIGVDCAIHGVAIVGAIVGMVVLLLIASAGGGFADMAIVALYSAALLAMFACSAAYNLGRQSRHRTWLRALDQVAIFIMIAASYSPFTVLHLEGAWSVVLTSVVWVIAVGGILVRLLHVRLFDRISIGLYLSFGWVGLVAIIPLVQALALSTMALLAAGGILYTIGVMFHRWEGLPYQNAIWHAFVLAAAAIHFAAVASSLVSSSGPI